MSVQKVKDKLIQNFEINNINYLRFSNKIKHHLKHNSYTKLLNNVQTQYFENIGNRIISVTYTWFFVRRLPNRNQ